MSKPFVYVYNKICSKRTDFYSVLWLQQWTWFICKVCNSISVDFLKKIKIHVSVMNNYKSFPADFDYIHVCISVYSSVSSLIYIPSKSYLILNFDLELSNDKNYDVKDKNISWYFKNFQYFDRYIESWIDKIQA